jgi:Adenylate kinase
MSALNSTCGVIVPVGSATHKQRRRGRAVPSPQTAAFTVSLQVKPPRVASSRDTHAWRAVQVHNGAVWECKATGQLKVIIAGAPASGKGTQARGLVLEPPSTAWLSLTLVLTHAWRLQCELIVQRFGLAHISAGDLLRAEVAAGTPAGKRAKDFMDRGDLVPDEVRLTSTRACWSTLRTPCELNHFSLLPRL